MTTQKDYTKFNNFFYSWCFYLTNGLESDIIEYDYNYDLQDYAAAWSQDTELMELSFIDLSQRKTIKWT